MTPTHCNPPLNPNSHHRHIPFGPDPPIPLLSQRSLRLAFNILTTAEAIFLQRLPVLYPRIDRKNIANHNLAFEVVAFIAGLKKCVVIGWGDGTSEEKRVGEEWLKDVWEGALSRLRRARSVDGDVDVDGDGDADMISLLEFMDGCVIHRLGNVGAGTAVFEGYTAIYYPPSGPALKRILDVGAFPIEAQLKIDDDTEQFDESLWAHVFDYPTVMPEEDAFTQRIEQMVTLGIIWRDSIGMGTQYYSLKTPSDEKLCRDHWRRYRDRLGEALDGLDIAISWDGKWEFAVGWNRDGAPTQEEWWLEMSRWTKDVLGEPT
jgi:hypothetical protein